MKRDLKNIIVVYDYAEINGGAAKVAIQSAIALSKKNFNVYYFAASGPICDELTNSEVKTICLNLNDINHGSRISAIINGVWNRTVAKDFSKFLDGFSKKNTVVHIHGWAKALSSTVVRVSCKKGFNTIITLHDYFTLCPNGGFYNYCKQKICELKPMSTSCVCCNCDKRSYIQKLWRILRQAVQDKNVRNNPRISFISISDLNEAVVKPYVKSKSFYRVKNPVEWMDYQVEDCTRSNRFLYVGRLSEEKGIELFCEAIGSLKEKYDIEGYVVGDGFMYNYLRSKYKNIHFVGWKSSKEVSEYYQNSRALVFPSKWYEGAPLTIIEAMSAGLPCIVSDCSSATEVIKDGENGFVFKSGNLSSLEETIVKAIDNVKIKDIQDKILNTDLKSDYSIEEHTNNIIKVYEGTL